MGYRLTSFDSVPVPQSVGASGAHDVGAGHLVSRPAHAGSGTVHHPLVALPGGQSFDPLGTDTAPRIAVDFGVSGLYVAAVETTGAFVPGLELLFTQLPAGRTLRHLIDTWLTRLGKTGLLVRTGDDGSQQSATARLVVVDLNRRAQNRYFLPTALQFTVLSPPWQGLSHDTTTTNPASVNLTNAGDVTQNALRLTVSATNYRITSVIILNTTTGQQVTWTGVLAPFTSLVLDTGLFTATNNGVDAVPSLVPTKERWVSLAPGANALTVTIVPSGHGETLRAQYADAWA